MNIQPDTQIKEMPKCGVCDKDNGFIYAYGKFMCGFCVQKIQSKQKERESMYIAEMISEVKNDN